MTADVVVSRELKSLQDELSAGQRERSAPPPVAPMSLADSAAPLEDNVEEHELSGHLRELVNEVRSFFEETEKGIAAHPTQSVVGALVVGILIGRLLGRR